MQVGRQCRGQILGNAIRKTGPELASNGRIRRQPTPIRCDFPRSAVIGFRRLLPQELVRAIGSGFKSPLPHQPSLGCDELRLGRRAITTRRLSRRSAEAGPHSRLRSRIKRASVGKPRFAGLLVSSSLGLHRARQQKRCFVRHASQSFTSVPFLIPT